MNGQISHIERRAEVIDITVQKTCNDRQNLIYILSVLMLGILLSISLATTAAEGTWTQKADMPTARFVTSSGVVDGKIYVIGGQPGKAMACLKTVEEYDPATDTWTKKANMPMVRGAGASSVVNGRIYVIGGQWYLYEAPYSSVEEYDATTDTWTAKANMPTARSLLSSSVVDGKIYAIGGALTYEGTTLSRVEEYDPATDTWTRKADMPTARACLSTSAVNGKIYAIGGTLGNPWYRGLSTVEEYDPATDTWTKKADMPTARSGLTTCAVNGKIYAIGGLTTGHNHLSPVEEYDPATDTWTRKADMPTARSGLTTCAVNGKMYAIGGWADSNYTGISTVEEYDTGLTVSSPDFNGDGLVDIKDLLRLIESWGQDDPLVDIAPPPFGDGVVDTADLELLMSYWGQPVDDPTLIAHWALDEAEGIVAYDSAGVNDAFVIGGAEWQPSGGQVDGALQLDGIDGCAVAGPALNTADGSFSIVAWTQGGAPGQVTISQSNGANWLVTDPSTGCLMTELSASGRNGGPLLSETEVIDGTWHRIGFVWDGAYRTLYVDDVLVAEDTHQGLESSLGGLNIGCGMNSAAGTFFSGLIDDIRIYNRTISYRSLE
jgi:N-acetylneuraminic acid mutarotase